MEGPSKPAVSVILPVYNGSKTIVRAIESIVHQTYLDWELLVVDDGSTDNTKYQVKEVHDDRVKYLHLPHGGIAKALNYGIKLAEGQFIARMDADDVSLPRRLEKQVGILERNSDLGVIATQTKHLGNKEQQGYKYHVDWTNSLISMEQHYVNRFQDAPLAHPSVMFRKSLFYQYGGYSEEGLPEDFELWLRWMHHGVHFEKVPEVLLHWQDRQSRLSRTHENYHTHKFFELKAYYFEKWYQGHQIKRPLWVFGTGRSVNQRIKPLLELGMILEKHIDVKPAYSEQVIHYQDLPKATSTGPFVLSYVSDREGKIAICEYLNSLDYVLGKDYLLMA